MCVCAGSSLTCIVYLLKLSLTVAKDKDFEAKPPLLSELPKANGEVNDSVFKLEILAYCSALCFAIDSTKYEMVVLLQT